MNEPRRRSARDRVASRVCKTATDCAVHVRPQLRLSRARARSRLRPRHAGTPAPTTQRTPTSPSRAPPPHSTLTFLRDTGEIAETTEVNPVARLRAVSMTIRRDSHLTASTGVRCSLHRDSTPAAGRSHVARAENWEVADERNADA